MRRVAPLLVLVASLLLGACEDNPPESPDGAADAGAADLSRAIDTAVDLTATEPVDQAIAELPAAPPDLAAPGPDLAAPAIVIGNAPTLGPADAPVVLVEFSDFQCPFCGAQEPILAQIVRDYGPRLRLVYKHFPLTRHIYAHDAAEASEAAHAQGRFWPYHDELFLFQNALTGADLETYAMRLGLDMTAFRQALAQHTYAAIVDADLAQGRALGVGGTPTMFLNGRMIVGLTSYDDLAAAIDAELRAAGLTPPPHPDMTAPPDAGAGDR